MEIRNKKGIETLTDTRVPQLKQNISKFLKRCDSIREAREGCEKIIIRFLFFKNKEGHLFFQTLKQLSTWLLIYFRFYSQWMQVTFAVPERFVSSQQIFQIALNRCQILSQPDLPSHH